jgi:hypothetical protein
MKDSPLMKIRLFEPFGSGLSGLGLLFYCIAYTELMFLVLCRTVVAGY